MYTLMNKILLFLPCVYSSIVEVILVLLYIHILIHIQKIHSRGTVCKFSIHYKTIAPRANKISNNQNLLEKEFYFVKQDLQSNNYQCHILHKGLWKLTNPKSSTEKQYFTKYYSIYTKTFRGTTN